MSFCFDSLKTAGESWGSCGRRVQESMQFFSLLPSDVMGCEGRCQTCKTRGSWAVLSGQLLLLQLKPHRHHCHPALSHCSIRSQHSLYFLYFFISLSLENWNKFRCKTDKNIGSVQTVKLHVVGFGLWPAALKTGPKNPNFSRHRMSILPTIM